MKRWYVLTMIMYLIISMFLIPLIWLPGLNWTQFVVIATIVTAITIMVMIKERNASAQVLATRLCKKELRRGIGLMVITSIPLIAMSTFFVSMRAFAATGVALFLAGLSVLILLSVLSRKCAVESQQEIDKHATSACKANERSRVAP